MNEGCPEKFDPGEFFKSGYGILTKEAKHTITGTWKKLSGTKLIVLKTRKEVNRFVKQAEKEGRFIPGNYPK